MSEVSVLNEFIKDLSDGYWADWNNVGSHGLHKCQILVDIGIFETRKVKHNQVVKHEFKQKGDDVLIILLEMLVRYSEENEMLQNQIDQIRLVLGEGW